MSQASTSSSTATPTVRVYTPGTDQLISTTTTIAGGFYTFTNLCPVATPAYLVVITSTNFVTGGPLKGYQNSTLTVDGNSDLNSTDHGNVVGALDSGGYVASTPVSVTSGMNPPTMATAMPVT